MNDDEHKQRIEEERQQLEKRHADIIQLRVQQANELRQKKEEEKAKREESEERKKKETDIYSDTYRRKVIEANDGTIKIGIEDRKGFTRLESKLIIIGKNEWKFFVYLHNEDDTDYLGYSLHCNEDFKGNFVYCVADIRISIDYEQKKNINYNCRKTFKNGDKTLVNSKFMKWDELIEEDSKFLIKKAVWISADIKIISNFGQTRFISYDFSSPQGPLTDGILLVEDKPVYVGKQILAQNSEYFETLFYKQFREKDEETIPLPNVVYSEFIDLLQQVYSSDIELKLETVGHVLYLARQFQFNRVTNKCERFLMRSGGLSNVDALEFAAEYSLGNLQHRCYELLSTRKKIETAMNHKDAANFSTITKDFLVFRLKDLNEQIKRNHGNRGEFSDSDLD